MSLATERPVWRSRQFCQGLGIEVDSNGECRTAKQFAAQHNNESNGIWRGGSREALVPLESWTPP
jgi:hypothetical protein